ncbi:MAG: hypothetical protein JNM68_07980 [Dinghuibacter sp.]|nr:hypothetical protein [Dinghuibacter sp.]
MLPAKPLPEFFIGKVKSQELISNFMQKKYAALNNTIPSGAEETRSVWYSFEHIEQLYKELVYLNADGLRIYFGAYGENCTDPNTNLDHSHQLCLVMLPTYNNPETGKHRDIVLELMEGFRHRNGSDLFVDADGHVLNQPPGGAARGFNQGLPCPPVCGGQECLFPE